ncbi:MAG: hypothetical protein ABI333_24505 [bacterium]
MRVWHPTSLLLCACTTWCALSTWGACSTSGEPSPGASTARDGEATARMEGGAQVSASRGDAAAVQRLFAKAHHLDAVLGQRTQAEALYRRVVAASESDLEVQALAHLRLAELCRLRADRRCAMRELDWLINRARRYPALAKRAVNSLVRLLHPQAGKMSALTRGPPVSFTTLEQVPADVAEQFHMAEKELLAYVRVRLVLRMHNVDAVRTHKRARLNAALKAYAVLQQSRSPSALAASFFRQGSLHQDYAEALGRVQVPEAFLPREAAKLRGKFHAESVTHFQQAVELYRKVIAIRDVAAERWRGAAIQLEAKLARIARRRPAGAAR